MLLAAGALLVAAVVGLVGRLPETGQLDVQPAVCWTDARLAFDPSPLRGPVLVADTALDCHTDE